MSSGRKFQAFQLFTQEGWGKMETQIFRNPKFGNFWCSGFLTFCTQGEGHPKTWKIGIFWFSRFSNFCPPPPMCAKKIENLDFWISVLHFLIFWVSRFWTFWVSNFLGFQLSEFAHFKLSGFQTFCISDHLHFKLSRFPTFQDSDLPGFQIFEFQVSEFPIFSISDFPGFWISNIPGFQKCLGKKKNQKSTKLKINENAPGIVSCIVSICSKSNIQFPWCGDAGTKLSFQPVSNIFPSPQLLPSTFPWHGDWKAGGSHRFLSQGTSTFP